MQDRLTDLAQAQGDKLAVIDDRPDGTRIQWTFAELEANANKLGRILVGLGIEPGAKVLWCGHNSPWLAAMMHAARKIGAVSVPLNYRLTAEEAAYVTDNSDAELVFTDAEYAPLFEKIRNQAPQVREILVFDGPPGRDMLAATDLLAAASGDPPDTAAPPDAGGTMIYTSGTTGKPKGALRPGGAHREQLLRLIETIGYRTDDIYLTTGPLYHSGPGSFLGIAHLLGNTAVLQRRFNAEDWLRLVDKYRVSTTFSAPTPIRRVCQLPEEVLTRYDVGSMRIMIANAAPWSYALKQSYLARFPQNSLFEIYGSTELGVNTILRPEHQLSKPGSCGKPAPGIEIYLFTENGQPITAPHTPGELYVRNPNMFSTYYKAHDKYLADRRGDLQTVGDIAYFDEEGFYYICDRKKDMIISGGVNIYPAEVEATLERHPDILDVAVFGIPSEEWGESVHAVVVAREGSGLGADDVQSFARAHLASYKVPRSVSFIAEIPRTGSGKALKRVLREPFWKDCPGRVL